MRLPYEYEARAVPVAQYDRPLGGQFIFPAEIRVAFDGVDRPEDGIVWEVLRGDLSWLLRRPVSLAGAGPAAIRLIRRTGGGDAFIPAEGYSLRISPEGIEIIAPDATGLLYGVHTLVQWVGMSRFCGRDDRLDCRAVLDWPHYRFRAIMIDLGRAIFSREMLQRCVRICSRLKLNALHLHLHENELNPVRYPGTPLGSENPWALELSDYEELIRYGARWNVEVFPELESWGHAGSLLQHYPHLYGATRLHGYGHALGIGPESLKLMEGIFDAWAAILPDNAKVHLGLDEANWRLLPGADPKVYNRRTLVPLFVDLLESRARAHGKRVQPMIWGQPAQLFIPAELRDRIIVEPYAYDLEHRSPVDLLGSVKPSARAEPFAATPHRPFVCGGGMSSIHQLSALAATESWSRNARGMHNCLGVDICVWETNDIASRLVGIFGGADLMWNPPSAGAELRYTRESAVAEIALRMRVWQAFTPDADPDALTADRGPEVARGVWRWGEKMGRQVIPIWMPERPVLGDFYGPGEEGGAA